MWSVRPIRSARSRTSRSTDPRCSSWPSTRLEKAEQYYLGLYRLSTLVHTLAHRTLILCNKDDLRRVYELCHKEYFDDYILFWPLTHDAPRLPMAIHHALRQLAAGGAGAPTVAEFAAQARRLVATESLLAQHAARGSARIDVTSRSLAQAQHDIGLALDGFTHQLVARRPARPGRRQGRTGTRA